VKNTYTYTLILITVFYTTQTARANATFATCNEADKTGTGMRCAGAMPSTNLWGNTFKSNHTGFRLAGNGLIGPQFRNTPGNEWASDNK